MNRTSAIKKLPGHILSLTLQPFLNDISIKASHTAQDFNLANCPFTEYSMGLGFTINCHVHTVFETISNLLTVSQIQT